ncbi:MAG: ERF family protein [Xanthobacteraceae bacterium]
MHRSSETIGTIAAALAKAQAQLVNPEKSLVGTIRSDGRGGAERSFRYAPLSSGLDIVRKTLSQHEIATVQITSIDESAGIVQLSTVLAHASGEWIASDWPVCAIAETATPHRMGAALTYARRYGLFTLVGIAGEDDLDAPDLIAPTTPAPKTEPGKTKDRLNGGPNYQSQGQSRSGQQKVVNSARTLEPKASEVLRDQLIAQLKALNSAEEAAAWAHQVLASKDSLVLADAKQVELAFQLKLSALLPDQPAVAEQPEAPRRRPQRARSGNASVNKTVLALPVLRRIRDREHVKAVAKQPCLVCGRRPADAHHLRFAQSRALGRKVSDEFTVPLCRIHHREVHHCGDEAAWWSTAGIDPTITARALWLKTHPLPPTPDDPDLKRQDSVPVVRS